MVCGIAQWTFPSLHSICAVSSVFKFQRVRAILSGRRNESRQFRLFFVFTSNHHVWYLSKCEPPVSSTMNGNPHLVVRDSQTLSILHAPKSGTRIILPEEVYGTVPLERSRMHYFLKTENPNRKKKGKQINRQAQHYLNEHHTMLWIFFSRSHSRAANFSRVCQAKSRG